MQIGKTLYAKNRAEWRAWLQKHHGKEKEIWLIYYKLNSGKPRIPYNDAVEEALCFGWIDSTLKPIDAKKFAQRFSPRRPGSGWSEPNKERIKKMIACAKMTSAGLEKASEVIEHLRHEAKHFVVPPDILKALKRNERTWKNFCRFSQRYKRIRVSWIDAARHRPEIFESRLRYFVKMTALNKKFGMVL